MQGAGDRGGGGDGLGGCRAVLVRRRDLISLVPRVYWDKNSQLGTTRSLATN
jgi:hypothetical protein